MSDFFQNGEIATYHKLKRRELVELEAELEQASKHRPISLVLPTYRWNFKEPVFPESLKNSATYANLKT